VAFATSAISSRDVLGQLVAISGGCPAASRTFVTPSAFGLPGVGNGRAAFAGDQHVDVTTMALAGPECSESRR